MIALSNVSKQYGRQILFLEVSFQLNPGEKVGLVGPNGVREDDPVPDDRGGGVGRRRRGLGPEADHGRVLPAGRRGDVGTEVLDEAIAGSGRLGDLHHELADLERAMQDPARADDMEAILDRFGHVQEAYHEQGGYEIEARAREVLHGLGFDDAAIDGDVGALSGGWKMRVAMAKVLLGRPDVLLMDEPTNHLDIESILWLETFLRDYPGALLMTCHDRDFMNQVVSRIVEVDGGDLISYSGNYEFYERERALRETQLEAAYARQQAMLAKESRFIERFGTHVAKAAQVQSRVKRLEKIELIEPPRRRKVVKFEFRKPPRSGDDVAMAEGVVKRYGPKTIYDGFDLTIRRGDRWCVMGANGAGKTTLLKMVAGQLAPDAGRLRLGASLKMGYFAQQSLDLLDPELTVFEQFQRDFPLETQGVLRAILGAFQFSGSDVDKKVRVLSGGERTRLVIARMLLDPPNFLVLDEPTNHLDLETKEMLVEGLKEFEGTMLFVSHDRTFLRGLANRVLELDPASGRPPLVYPGSYVEYVARSGHEAPGVHT